MKNVLGTWLISALSVMVVAWLLPGIHVSGLGGALISAAIIGIVNALVRPLLQILTFPITILTLGFFLLIVNGLCLSLAAWVAGRAIEIDGFGWAFLGAIVLSIVTSILNSILKAEDDQD